MKSHELTSLLLLLLFVAYASALCSLDKQTAAQCHDLEDARYIDTYNLHHLRAPSSSKVLEPGNFRNLTSLRHLDLSGGKIETIKSGSFAKLDALQTLNLADNRIGHLEAGAFDGLKLVHSLKLGNNKIQQLPVALLTLKELRLLDVSGNPLNCNCASLKLRDALLARGVKISKKTQCFEPPSLRHVTMLKPDSRMACLFEAQDLEMQGDQPAEDYGEGSGEPDGDATLKEAEEDVALKEAEEDLGEEEKVIDYEEPTEPPPEVSEASSTTTSESVEVSSTEAASSTTGASDISVSAQSAETTKEVTTEEAPAIKPAEEEEEAEKTVEEEDKEEEEEEEKNDDLIVPVIVPTKTTESDSTDTSSSTRPGIHDELIVPAEGSGEDDDDGSGLEGSGLIAKMPAIDFNETSSAGDEEEAVSESSSTSTTSTTTESSGIWGIGSALLNTFNIFGSSDSTTAAPATASTTEKSPEDAAKDEGFIVTEKPVAETPVAPKIVQPDTKQSPRTLMEPSDQAEEGDRTEKSQEPKKGMGSYVVLAILLAILTILIGFAAYKGDFCRKKPKRRDVERGTELKDMQKSLLEQQPPPKIQVSNGSTLENVPLMNSALPEEPKDNQRSYDVTTNGKSNGTTIDPHEPPKPPRRSPDQIEAPLNGLNPPMEDIDATDDGSSEYLNGHYDGEQPPLSPNAQRVKITLQENPDSVPKTPILITRLKAGENLVKSP